MYQESFPSRGGSNGKILIFLVVTTPIQALEFLIVFPPENWSYFFYPYVGKSLLYPMMAAIFFFFSFDQAFSVQY